MAKNLKRGGSSRATPQSYGGEPAERKGKVVTFKVDEIVPAHVEDLNRNAPPNPAAKNDKGKKGKFDLTEIDKGLEKMKEKFAKKSVPSTSDPSMARLYSHEPWELDPTFLKIDKVLGTGSYGRVYKGTYKGERVAIKMLEWGDPRDNDLDKELSLQYQFFNEVKLMYKLENHPNVCRLIGASMGSTNFQVPSPQGRSQVQVAKMMCCIVMEYIDHGNLREFWINHRRSGNRRMPFGVIVQFALDIAEGLAFLHSKKICHRDLKPDNILMADDSRLKIADFGLSRTWPEKGEDAMSMYQGTPNYTAPEILDGKIYSYKCDVYSYGICVWEIFTCDVPYPEITNIDRGSVNERIVHKKLRPPIPCCCPPELRRVITRCWHPDPNRRPEMAEVVQWLSAIDTDKVRCITNDAAVECCACLVESTCGYRP